LLRGVKCYLIADIEYKNMKVGVTGATGHIGANLVRDLLKYGHDVRVLVRNGKDIFNGLNVEYVKGDLLDIKSLNKFCKGLDVVEHLAASISIGGDTFKNVYEVNVIGTQNVLNACRNANVRRFIHFSSIHAMSHIPLNEVMDENRPLQLNSKSTYEKTKAIAEQWVLEQNTKTFEVLVLNPTAVVGPYDFKPSFIGRFILMLYKGRIPAIIPGGYDWVDVRDISMAAVNAITMGAPGQKFILSGKWREIQDFADIISTFNGKKHNIPVIPLWMAKMGLPFMSFGNKIMGKSPLYTLESLNILQHCNNHISSNKAVKELNYSARPLEDTLRDTLLWFKKMSYF